MGGGGGRKKRDEGGLNKREATKKEWSTKKRAGMREEGKKNPTQKTIKKNAVVGRSKAGNNNTPPFGRAHLCRRASRCSQVHTNVFHEFS